MEGKPVADDTGFSRYVDGLRAAAQKLTSSDSETEDLVQECLASAVQGVGRVRKTEVLGAWLHQILRRKWYDLLRRRALDRRHRIEGLPRAVAAEPEPAGNEIVRRVLAGLDADARRVLEMRFFQSRTSVEIARELKRPVGTVRSQLFHALRKFESAFHRTCPKETV
jgi:RNA polymerase sigma-70 factor (ECF subfamily)